MADRPLWVGYPRVSYMGRRRLDADDFHSVRQQERAMRVRAAELGVDLEIVDPDLNAKGKDPERETLQQIMEAVEDGRYSGVMVAYLSRLSRRTRLTLELWDRVRAAGARLIAVRENLDSANMTPESDFLVSVFAAKDQLEVDIATARFDEQRAGAVAAGIWAFRQIPIGYDKDPATRRLVPGTRRADAISAFRSAPTTPIITIARTLGMSTSGVRRMLESRVYRGELHVGGCERDDGTITPKYENLTAHEPLVTEEEWLAANQALRTGTRPPRGSYDHPALCGGFTICAGCGRVMSRARQTRGVVYSCSGFSAAGRCPGRAAIKADLLDEHVEQVVLGHLRRLREHARPHVRDLDADRLELQAARADLAAYLEMVDIAELGPEIAAAGARRRNERVRRVEQRIAAKLARQPLAIDEDPVDIWMRSDLTQKNRLSRSLIEAVVVAPAGRGRRVPPAERVRVIAHGAGIVTYRRSNGRPLGIRPIALADLDDEVVLRM